MVSGKGMTSTRSTGETEAVYSEEERKIQACEGLPDTEGRELPGTVSQGGTWTMVAPCTLGDAGEDVRWKTFITFLNNI